MADYPQPVFFLKCEEGHRSCAQGEVIFHEGDEGDEVFAVQHGSVDIITGGTTIEKGAPGDVFGEMSLINATPRSATAIATTDCEVVAIDKKRYDEADAAVRT